MSESNDPTTKFRRRKIYVDRDVQQALLRQLVMHWLCVLAIMFGILVAAEFIKAGLAIDFAGSVAAALQTNVALIVGIVLLAPYIVYELIKLSHRFVGPMVGLRRALRDLAQGKEVQPLHFRKNDFWRDIADNLNVVLAKMQELQVAGDKDSVETEVLA